MKINEVESLVGITKKNIRFYEEQGLINPGRNKENGYRSYSSEDIKKLEQIKLLRKLGIPIEEIRSMQLGTATVSDCMKRHIVSLQRKQSNLTHAIALCNELKDYEIPLSDLDANSFLNKMSEIESTGAVFKNISKNDIRAKKYAGAFLASMSIVLMVIATLYFLFWSYKSSPEDAPPIWFFLFIGAILIAVLLGVIYSLVQRVGEIQKGEIDDAREF